MKLQHRIRRANREDAGAAFGLMGTLGYRDLDRSAFEFVFGSLTSLNDAAVLVAEDGSGRIVGLAAVSWRLQLRLAGTLVSLDELVVDPGQRDSGVGRALLEQVKAIAGQAARPAGQPWRLQLETDRGRESYKRAFYAKNGFQEVNSALFRYSPG